ncbi:MAG: NTP transferase domain-containing protein [Bacteroidia bacterium]|nr:NTP transferase domain-containing protein [Bacteroidia bacterium]MCZ2277798.1 NTP transferase domain-containing protein [Bacteroidia bacterium]
MKVIIPVAGIGSKLRPHTHTQPKALVPVAGKPILSHIIDQQLIQGADDFIFIIGYLGDKIEGYVRSRYPKLRASFVVQEPRRGTGHAVWTARDYVRSGDELLIILGDTIVDFDLKAIRNYPHSALGIKKVSDPRQFGVAEVNDEGLIIRVKEKPAIPKSNFALVGVYYIRESDLLFNSLGEIHKKQESDSDEFSLTDAIEIMLAKGIRFCSFITGNWFDCGNKESLLLTNATLLKRMGKDLREYSFPDSIIIQPTVIGTNCRINNSIIGPDVSIDENTIIESSIISNSIIGSYSHISTAVLHHSIIGSDASLKGLSQSLNIGDSTEIDFS